MSGKACWYRAMLIHSAFLPCVALRGMSCFGHAIVLAMDMRNENGGNPPFALLFF